jgi:hypothetical protein
MVVVVVVPDKEGTVVVMKAVVAGGQVGGAYGDLGVDGVGELLGLEYFHGVELAGVGGGAYFSGMELVVEQLVSPP